MRNKSMRKSLSPARLMVLALCFVMMFALVLSLTMQTSNGISNAEETKVEDVTLDKKDAATLGYANAIYGDHGELDGSYFGKYVEEGEGEDKKTSFVTTGYPGLKNQTSWTFTETYNTIVPSIDNHQIYKQKGDTIIYTHVGEANNWYIGVSNAIRSAEVHGVINFNTNGFIAKMVQNDNATITATIMATMSANSAVDNIFFAPIAVPVGKTMTAGLSYDLKNNESKSGQDKTGFVISNDGNAYTEKSNKTEQEYTVGTITLDATTPNFAFAFGCDWGYKASATDRRVYVHDIKVTYTITFKDVEDSDSLSVDDGASPIVSSQYDIENEYLQGVSGSGYAPYIENKTDAPVYYETIKNYVKTDSVVHGNGKLQSYTNKSLNKDYGNIDESNLTAYYKYAQTEFVDLYNYSGSSSIKSAIQKYGEDASKVIGAGDRIFSNLSVDENGKISLKGTETDGATHLKYASGIKTVTVNDATFNMWDSSDYFQIKEFHAEEDGKEYTVGYAKVAYTNRSRVVVSLYLTNNGTVQTTVTDYGDASIRTSIEVSGIDTTAPSGNTEISYEDCIGTTVGSLSDLDWYRQSVLDATGSIVDEETQGAPYLWFYTVDRTHSYTIDDKGIVRGFSDVREFEDFEEVKSLGILPIAVGNISSFVYDFEKGLANAYGGKLQGNPRSKGSTSSSTSITGPTGEGYYRFTFYMFDLAGNMGGKNSVYVKVDYETAKYTVDLSYGEGDKKTTISSSQNGAWATDDITLKLKVNTHAFTGYTLSFMIDDEYHALVVDGFGDTARTEDKYGYTKDTFTTKLVKYVTSAGDIDVEGNTVEISSVKTDIGALPLTIKYDGKSKEFTFTIKAQDKVNFAWITEFVTNPGQYTKITDVESLIEEDQGHVEDAWSGGVQMLLDCTKPEFPTMTDADDAENAYLNALNDYTQLPTDRVWYTQALKSYLTVVSFYDDIIESKYANDINVYYAFKVVKSLGELEALADYESLILNNSSKDLQDYFNHIEAIRGDRFTGESTDVDINLISGQNAGMRVFYVWAEDQAGNKSDISTYYVLADANLYTISASVKNNSALLRNSANISFVNEEGDAVTSFKRGEKVMFTLGLSDGYAPFSLSLNGNKLLENYIPQTVSSAYTWTSSQDFAYITTDGYSKVEYVVDNSVSLGELDSKQAFVFAHRKVVDYTIATTKVSYTSQPTDVLAQTVFEELASKGKFEYKFFDEEGNDIAVPKNVGKYYVSLYIPKEDDTYVTADFAMDESGEQVFARVAYEIIKGTATITAKPTTSIYGDIIKLAYTVSGVAEENLASEGFDIKPALDVASWDATAKYDVGTYQVVIASYIAEGESIDNYNVVLVGATHTILQREVNVYTMGASKQYKESDPLLRFGVKLADYSKDAQAIIFAGYKQDDSASNDEYIVYLADGRLARESGEAVGKYSYLNTASKFDVNSNYRVVLQTTNTFEIKQRVVTLDVSGQSSVYPYGTEISSKLAEIKPTYRLKASDMALADEVAELVNSITLGTSTSLDIAGYNSVVGYKFVLDADETSNIKIVIADDAQYIIYITEQNTIIIRAKAGAKFENTYGFVSSKSFSLPYSQDMFEIVGTPSGEFTNVNWSASIASENELVDAGSHVVIFSNAKLVNGETELSDKVVVEQIVYTINPAKIVVKPIVQNLAKTYGEDDSVYGIGYAIDTIAGLSISEVSALVGVDEATLNALVSGAYARAIYDNSGKSAGYATRYDSATESGVIIDTDGAYYGIGIATTFTSSNANFVVQATLNDELRLEINRKELAIHTKDFVGVSKYYDGTTDVNYGTSAMYNIADYLVRIQDEVELSANAVYDVKGAPTVNTSARILFSNLALIGKDAHNYVIVDIVNDSADCTIEGHDGNVEDVSVTICYINNADGTEHILIKKGGTITLSKSDITVSKQYDGTSKLFASNIIIKNSDDTALIANNTNMIVVGGAFKDSDVSSNYLIATLKIFFPFEDIEGISVTQSDVTIDLEETYNGKSGVMITISNIGASITQRVIDADSFLSITAVDREYNKTKDVTIKYELSNDVLALGDTLQTLGLKLTGVIASANVGRYTVKEFKANASVIDDNYIVDIDSINSRFKSVEVEISKASLTPVVDFVELTYSGNAKLTKDKDFSGLTGQFSTAYGILEGISFDVANIEFALSSNGVQNENVQANGLHNILVSGLNITFDGSWSQEDKDAFVQNHKLAGARYSTIDKKYVAITDIGAGFVEDYELIDFVVLNQKEIVLTTNDFKITEKVYDGTTKAEIIIDIVKDAEGKDRLVDTEHEKMLEVVASGKFEKPYAMDNLKVIIDKESVELRVKSGLDSETLAVAEVVIGNYKLKFSYDSEISGNRIKPRPIAVSVDFGEQVYNGEEKIIDNGIHYNIENVLNRDVCDITTQNGAYYVDKNVALDKEGNVILKSGTAYGVALSDVGNTSNYTAVYKSSKEIAGNSLVAYILSDGEWVYKSAVDSADKGRVAYYCYAFEKTQKYILATSADKLEVASDAIIGFNIVNGKDVYMVAYDYAGETDGTLDAPITYLRGEGTIAQRVVRLSSDGIIITEGSTAYTKVYDGTTKFYGSVDVDYSIISSAVSNLIAGDDVQVDTVTAEFESVKVGSTNVIFTAHGISGKDVGNYTSYDANAVLKVRFPARITPLTIKAELQSAERTYGSTEMPSNIKFTIPLSDSEDSRELIWVDRTLYMNFKEFLVATKLTSTVDTPEGEYDSYIKSLYARRYNLVGEEFKQADDGEYIILGGANDAIIYMPKATTTLSSRAEAGSTASASDLSYTLSEGKANNYVFERIYTEDSVLTIVKKTVYIVAETKDFAKTYGSANPEIKLSILDANGASGLASTDQWNTLFKVGGVDYGPIVKLGIFNRKDSTITPVDEYAKISADLGEDEVYVFYLQAPNGADYSTIKNYNVIYQGTNGDDYVLSSVNGNAVWNFAGASFTKSASTLTISLPEITGISVGTNEENVFTYQFGKNWVYEALRGELETDEVGFIINGIKSEAIDAGVYEGEITLTRYINADGSFVSADQKDKNGYFIEWNSGDKVRIVVAKQTIDLRADGMSVYYDGSEQSYSEGKITHTPIYDNNGSVSLAKDYYIISYQVYDAKTNSYVDTDVVKNAGKYRVTIALNDAFENDYPNLAKGTNASCDLYVLKAVINVTISTNGFTGGSEMVDNSKITKLFAKFDENATYNIDYSIAMDEKSNASAIAVVKSQTKLVLSKSGTIMSLDQINEAGRYTFSILLDDESLDFDNYTINGGAGVLELTINKLSDSNGNVIDLGDGATVANRLVVKEVVNGSTLATDMAYLATVKQHVANLSKQAGYSKNASVAAVYRVMLYCDDKVVVSDGDITVSVAVPDTLGNMKGIELYTVTSQGELQKITDYKVVDGKIVYTTDYVSGIVFVDTNGEGLASWAIYTIVAVVVGVVLIAGATVVAIILRKRNMQKLG